mmetsp:Transcript_9031/g.23411  ORF Transcript_9031/g.23411 Transcript_9031/m.23411 type:complete len:270 (+) Transcript_9031:481-1290(+)
MATRPCLISEARSFRNSSLFTSLQKPAGSKNPRGSVTPTSLVTSNSGSSTPSKGKSSFASGLSAGVVVAFLGVASAVSSASSLAAARATRLTMRLRDVAGPAAPTGVPRAKQPAPAPATLREGDAKAEAWAELMNFSLPLASSALRRTPRAAISRAASISEAGANRLAMAGSSVAPRGSHESFKPQRPDSAASSGSSSGTMLQRSSSAKRRATAERRPRRATRERRTARAAAAALTVATTATFAPAARGVTSGAGKPAPATFRGAGEAT